jgi:hypothetical protein
MGSTGVEDLTGVGMISLPVRGPGIENCGKPKEYQRKERIDLVS